MRRRNFSIAKPFSSTGVYTAMRSTVVAGLFLSALLTAQAPTAPVVNPRGVVNAFTRQPAPSAVAQGGIIWINGINLGPAGGWKAEPGNPLPSTALDPAIEVRIGQRAIPIYSITPSRIVAQIPLDTPPGVTQIIVRRGDQQSAPARFTVTQPNPSVYSELGGFGAAGIISGNTLTLRVAGLGQTEPATAAGALPAPDNPASPRTPIRANIGGMPAPAIARLSNEVAGEFEVAIELPATVRDGDVVNLFAANNAGNRVTLKSLRGPKIEFLPLPAGSANLRALIASDLRPGFMVVNGIRADDGCYPSILIDFEAAKADSLPGCFTSAAAQLLSPFVSSNDGNALAALVGPADGDPATGISSKLTILQPAAEARTVELPGKAVTVGGAPGGNFNALIPGTPIRLALIDAESGAITEGAPAGGGIQIGGGGGGGGLNINNLQIDLGDGVKELVTPPIGLGQNQQAIVGVDSLETVTKAKFAIINPQAEILQTVDFPEGWLPLLAPTQNAPVQGGGNPGGGQGPGGGQPPGGGQNPGGLPGGGVALVNRFRAATQFDPTTRQYYVLARATDKSKDAFIRFPVVAGQPPQVIPFSEGKFAASCTNQIRTFNLELARRVALPTSSTPENLIRTACGASSFITLDFNTRQINEISLPGQGLFNITGNAANDVNDYVYGSNTDPAQQGRSDTLYVFDGVTSSAFRLDLPPEVSSFSNLNTFPPMGILYAQATARAVGDAGIVLFDLESASTRLLPTPAGFISVQPLTIFPATRKLIARGTRTEPAATQILIYDLGSGDLQIIANPDGVSFVGAVPNTPAQPGQPPAQQQPVLQNINPKSNAVTVVGFDAQRRPIGVLLVRAH